MDIINQLEYSAYIQQLASLSNSEVEFNNKVIELNKEILTWTRKRKALIQKKSLSNVVSLMLLKSF